MQTYQMDDGTEETSKAGSLAAAAAKRKTDMHKIAFSKRFMGREEQTQHACQHSSASLDNFSHVSRKAAILANIHSPFHIFSSCNILHPLLYSLCLILPTYDMQLIF